MSTETKILRETLESIMGERFGRYSKYIIQDRALPDARDGLKPVQRRILYAMYKEGNTSEKAFRKSAKTVGNVIGNYHPHGDSSVYEAMVRLSQDWKMRQLLVEMHGNNGSVDGDGAAAMRYTEARLSKISGELLRDIEKQTVDFVPNFDDSINEPTVLPARYPNLLVNGSTGISAGYATDIPPHNLHEIIDATIYRLKHPSAKLEKLMEFVQGPDFPTGAIVQGIEGIEQAFRTGRGRVIIRSKLEVIPGTKKQIIVTEIPYEVNKANLVRRIDEICAAKTLDGFIEVRDESDRQGLRIALDLKKDADHELILNYLYKNTDLQKAYNYNMVAIAHGRPETMGLIPLLDAYINHQIDVVTRRSNYDLRIAKDRQHIVEGLIKAISILDEVIATIRASKDRKDAIENLIAKYEFTNRQAEAIVQLQLYRLTNTDIVSLEAEHKELDEKILFLKSLLEDEAELRKEVVRELKETKDSFPAPRLSRIEHEVTEIKLSTEALISKREGIVTMTREGYVKFTTQRSFAASNQEDYGLKAGDHLIGQFQMENQQVLLAFTSGGNYLYIPVHILPEIRWKDIGQHINNLIQYNTNEKIIAVFAADELSDQQIVTTVSKNGMIKSSLLSDFALQRYSRATAAMTLKGDDEVTTVLMGTEQSQFVLMSKAGYMIVFSQAEVPVVKVKAAGVKAMKLGADDQVATAVATNSGDQFILVTGRATAKRLAVDELEYTGRYKKGYMCLNRVKQNPYEIISAFIYDNESNMVLFNQEEQVATFACREVKKQGLETGGMSIHDGDIDAVYLEAATRIIEKNTDKPKPTKALLDDVDSILESLQQSLTKEPNPEAKPVTEPAPISPKASSVTKQPEPEPEQAEEEDPKVFTIDDFLDDDFE
ncbi:DNA topoisomerase IV subunit A [Culicoidibacter larvae]|uniref:DNA topoisomerase 4 subunit A n=1 Tax=Culicoidibacter larvae TaxID=2579976 RepID=A0A5R8QAL1_9FIRM|nr:DNA topoisomerase IV subunit A [Culicoidibacter larvae]TLG72956.1 DNA topoisomerase IV subunit A [Culicoidibacter larvae]